MAANSKLNLDQIRILFAACAINEPFFRRVIEVLGSSYLGDDYLVHRFFLDSLKEHWDEFKTLPGLGLFRNRLNAQLTENIAPTEDVQECSELYEIASNLNKEKPAAVLRIANTYLDRFVETQLATQLSDRLNTSDLSSLLVSTQRELLQAHASSNNRFESLYGESLDQRAQGRFTLIGNQLVDPYTGGTGPATGDIIGHAAPRGSGKSTLVDQVAVEVAELERVRAKQESRLPRIVYIFNYEKVEDPLTHTLAYAAKIPRATVETFIYTKSLDDFSRERKYKPYELKTFRMQISQAQRGDHPWPRAELERFQYAREQLAQNLMIADFTGANPALAKLSYGFVPGIVEFIEGHQLSLGSPGVEAIFIDYASTCVRAHMRTLSVRDSTERKLLEDLPFQLKHMVANPQRCFAWVAHQLAAEEASKKGGTRPDPNKFKDCKSFAENVDYCIVNGKPTRDGLAIFVHSKSRRGMEQPDQVGRLVGDSCMWLPDNIEHTIVGGRVISRRDADDMYGGSSIIRPDRD